LNNKYFFESSVNYSFSSYEITLALYGNNLHDLSKVIGDLRSTDMSNLKITKKEKIRLNKYYNLLNDTDNSEPCNPKSSKSGSSKKEVLFKHFISDSQTHYGMRILAGIKESTLIINAFKLKSLKMGCPHTGFDIDFKLKPGHIKQFMDNLNYRQIVSSRDFYFTSGQTDLKLSFKSGEELYDFMHPLLEHKKLTKDCGLLAYLREMTTKVIFNDDLEVIENTKLSISSYCHKKYLNKVWEPEVLGHIFENFNVQYWLKLNRVLESYFNGINNSLTYNLYFDFYYFMKYLDENYKSIDPGLPRNSGQ